MNSAGVQIRRHLTSYVCIFTTFYVSSSSVPGLDKREEGVGYLHSVWLQEQFQSRLDMSGRQANGACSGGRCLMKALTESSKDQSLGGL